MIIVALIAGFVIVSLLLETLVSAPAPEEPAASDQEFLS